MPPRKLYFENVRVGDEIPAMAKAPVDRVQLARYAGATGDFHPLHVDEAYAKSLGMDSSKFDKCLDSGEKKTMVEEDLKAGSAAGVNGTPAFFINGVFINGAQPFEQIKQTVDRELKKKG